MKLFDILNLLSESYCYGFTIMSLILFLWTQRKKTNQVSLNISIKANNTLAIILSMMLLFKELITYFLSWYSQVASTQDAFNQEINSRYQMVLIICTAVAHYLLPLIMLNKELCKSIKSSLFIIAIWIVVSVLLRISFKAPFPYLSIPNIFTITLTYLILFSIVYFFIKSKNSSTKPRNTL